MENLKIVTEADEYNRVFESSLAVGFTSPETTKILTTHKAITNEDGSPIAVVGKNYNLVQNADIMPQFHEVILASNLDRTGMAKKSQQSHQGAKTIVT